jgi:hypothetical protein
VKSSTVRISPVFVDGPRFRDNRVPEIGEGVEPSPVGPAVVLPEEELAAGPGLVLDSTVGGIPDCSIEAVVGMGGIGGIGAGAKLEVPDEFAVSTIFNAASSGATCIGGRNADSSPVGTGDASDLEDCAISGFREELFTSSTGVESERSTLRVAFVLDS